MTKTDIIIFYFILFALGCFVGIWQGRSLERAEMALSLRQELEHRRTLIEQREAETARILLAIGEDKTCQKNSYAYE